MEPLTQIGATLTVTAWKTVFSGNVANGTKNILSGMSAVNVNVNENGILNISSGGVASSTKVNSGGSMNLFDGGAASDTTVNQGVLHIKSGGMATDTEIYFAIAKVSAGGIANRTTVNQDGILDLYYKGKASGTTVNKDGHFEVSNGGMELPVLRRFRRQRLARHRDDQRRRRGRHLGRERRLPQFVVDPQRC